MIKSWMAAVLVVAAVGGSAVAKSESGPKAEARRRFDAGMAHYNLREYKPAIDEFQAAYRLRPEPVLLYNLGQAYRLLDDPEQALYFYRAYLRNDERAPNRADVEARIEALQTALEQKRAAAQPAPKPSPPVVAPAPAPSMPAVAQADRRNDKAAPVPLYKRWWLWTAVGVVAAGAAAGIAVGVTAQKSASFDASIGTFGPTALRVRF
jgi:tetratricopeptide (TPR) repeat protein